jgi:hypothetical protein
VYRLRMNHFSGHAKTGTLEHNFNSISFRIRSGRRFCESFDGQTKATPQRSSSPKGCDDA